MLLLILQNSILHTQVLRHGPSCARRIYRRVWAHSSTVWLQTLHFIRKTFLKASKKPIWKTTAHHMIQNPPSNYQSIPLPISAIHVSYLFPLAVQVKTSEDGTLGICHIMLPASLAFGRVIVGWSNYWEACIKLDHQLQKIALELNRFLKRVKFPSCKLRSRLVALKFFLLEFQIWRPSKELRKYGHTFFELVVSTHLQKICPSNWIISLSRGEKKIFETTT